MACFLYGGGASSGDKAISGTFSGNGLTSKEISVEGISTAKFLMVTARLSDLRNNTSMCITYDFSNNYGFSAGKTTSNVVYPLASGTYESYRSTFSGGTLTINCSDLPAVLFASGVTYEWVLIGE